MGITGCGVQESPHLLFRALQGLDQGTGPAHSAQASFSGCVGRTGAQLAVLRAPLVLGPGPTRLPIKDSASRSGLEGFSSEGGRFKVQDQACFLSRPPADVSGFRSPPPMPSGFPRFLLSAKLQRRWLDATSLTQGHTGCTPPGGVQFWPPRSPALFDGGPFPVARSSQPQRPDTVARQVPLLGGQCWRYCQLEPGGARHGQTKPGAPPAPAQWTVSGPRDTTPAAPMERRPSGRGSGALAGRPESLTPFLL